MRLPRACVSILVQSEFQVGSLYSHCPATLSAFLSGVFNSVKWLSHEGLGFSLWTGLTPCLVFEWQEGSACHKFAVFACD